MADKPRALAKPPTAPRTVSDDIKAIVRGGARALAEAIAPGLVHRKEKLDQAELDAMHGRQHSDNSNSDY